MTATRQADSSADLTYADYINTDILLSLQETRSPVDSEPTLVLAEQFFIVAHQSCELWLKQVLDDLDAAALAMSDSDCEVGLEFVERSHGLLRLLCEQVLVLETLPLQYFVKFRPFLGSASGAQSVQFHRLGLLLGGRDREGRLYRAFEDASRSSGYSPEDVCRLGVATGVLHRLAEGLIAVGNAYWRWKIAHLALVSKMVGGQTGTGGSSGAEYLARRTALPFGALRRMRGDSHNPTGGEA